MKRVAGVSAGSSHLTYRHSSEMVCLFLWFLCTVCINNSYGYSFHWASQIETGTEAITPVPHVGNGSIGDQWPSVFDQQADNGGLIALMMRVKNSPHAPGDGNIYGAKSPGVLQEVLDYLELNGQSLDFVFADYECSSAQVSAGDCTRQDITDSLRLTIDMVKSHSNPAINSAFIGQYNFYPGAYDLSELWGNYERQEASTSYLSSGLSIAMPSMYPATAHRNHHARSDRHQELAVSLSHALFWTPLERYSTAMRALPADHLMIPWIGGLIDNPGYEAPVPSREELRSLVQHVRMRGADGYYVWSHGANTNYASTNEFRDDIYFNAWQPLDWFFQLEGESQVLNLTTNKTGGVEWSGVRRGNRVLMIYSNYSASEARVDQGHLGIADLPDSSPPVPANSHVLRDYTVGPLAQWGMDEGQGLTTRQSGSASSRSGVSMVQGELLGAEWVPGMIGQALRFNGAASVDFGDVHDLGEGDRTLSLWFNTSNSEGKQALLSKGHNLGNSSYVFFTNKGRLRARVNIAGRRYTVVSRSSVDDGQWHHAAAVVDRDDRMTLYLDGVVQGAVDISAGHGSYVQNSYPLSLGRTGRGNFYNGDIDGFKIYDSALDAGAILDDSSARLIARLDSTSGSQVHDCSIANLSASSSCETWGQGKQGGSLAFSHGCGASFGNVLDLGTQDRTVSLWFRTSSSGSYETLFSKGYSATSNIHSIFMNGGRLVALMDVSGTDHIVSSNGALLNDGQWHHLVLVMDRDGMMSLYVDGSLESATSIAADAATDATNGHPLYLGRSPQGQHFVGDLDEVKIYNRVLDDTERGLARGSSW